MSDVWVGKSRPQQHNCDDFLSLELSTYLASCVTAILYSFLDFIVYIFIKFFLWPHNVLKEFYEQ